MESASSLKLPTIDLSEANLDSSIDSATLLDRDGLLVQTVQQACEEVGFFVVLVPAKMHQAIMSAEKAWVKFFQDENRWGHLVKSDKKTHCGSNAANEDDLLSTTKSKDELPKAYGYFPMESEALGYEANVEKYPDIREAFSMGPVSPLSDRLRNKFFGELNWNGNDGDNNGDNDDETKFFRNVMKFCYQPTPWVGIACNENRKKDDSVANRSVVLSKCSSDDFQKTLCDFYVSASRLGAKVLQIMSLALGLPEQHFAEASSEGEHCNSARAIWYPKLRKEAMSGQARCGAHSDTGALTLLWSSGPGLEIRPRNSKEWKAIDTSSLPENAMIVNIGEALEFVSNQKWKSTPHRVPAPRVDDHLLNQDRLVLVLFVILAADFPMSGSGSDGTVTITQGEHLFSHFKRWGRNSE